MRIEEDLSQAHLRLARATIERLPWQECVARYDQDGAFFYMDPTYWQTEGYGVEFPWQEYEELAMCLRGLKGKALLSINDHPDIRAVFAGLPMEEVDIRYTVGGGGNVEEARELIIRSWTGEVGRKQGRLFG